jgi:hypothetical protein
MRQRTHQQFSESTLILLSVSITKVRKKSGINFYKLFFEIVSLNPSLTHARAETPGPIGAFSALKLPTHRVDFAFILFLLQFTMQRLLAPQHLKTTFNCVFRPTLVSQCTSLIYPVDFLFRVDARCWRSSAARLKPQQFDQVDYSAYNEAWKHQGERQMHEPGKPKQEPQAEGGQGSSWRQEDSQDQNMGNESAWRDGTA